MELELVPLDGQEAEKKSDKKRARKRYQKIPPKVLRKFTDEQQQKIKEFMIDLVLITHDLQHETESRKGTKDHEERLARLNKRRRGLFEQPERTVAQFIKLLSISALESREEIETLIRDLRREDVQVHYKTEVDTGHEAALDNPFLRRIKDNIEDDKLSLKLKTRLTNSEIESLIRRRSLQDIVDRVIAARRLTSGLFWRDSYYDL
jgi:hypothetical protein